MMRKNEISWFETLNWVIIIFFFLPQMRNLKNQREKAK